MTDPHDRIIGEHAIFDLDATLEPYRAEVAIEAFADAARQHPKAGLVAGTFEPLVTASLGVEDGSGMPGIVNDAVTVGGQATVRGEPRHVIVQFNLSPCSFEEQIDIGDLTAHVGVTRATTRSELLDAMAEERAEWVVVVEYGGEG